MIITLNPVLEWTQGNEMQEESENQINFNIRHKNRKGEEELKEDV